MSQARKPRFQEENSSGVQIAGQHSFHNRLGKDEASGCGGDGKPLKMSEQSYNVVWTTWTF